MYRWLAHGRADASEFGLCLRNGLPQLGPAPIGLVDLPPVDVEALLLELQQHPVPRHVGLTDLIPNHLTQPRKKYLNSSRTGRAERRNQQKGRGKTVELERGGLTLSSNRSESHVVDICCSWSFTALLIARGGTPQQHPADEIPQIKRNFTATHTYPRARTTYPRAKRFHRAEQEDETTPHAPLET